MESKPYSGAIFENNNKTSTGSPSFRGYILDDHAKYSLSAWDQSSGSNKDDTGRGFLFANPNKTSDKHPDLIGKIKTIYGTVLYIGAWKRISEKNVHYYSISLKNWDNQFQENTNIVLSLACKQWKEKESR